MKRFSKIVDLVDRINTFLSKIDNENIDKIKLELDAWDVENIREWNQKSLKYDHEQEMKERYIKDLNSPHHIIVAQKSMEQDTVLKIIGLLESLKYGLRVDCQNSIDRIIEIIRNVFSTPTLKVDIDQYGRARVEEDEK